jgi:iron complex transport system ATP-binding protein
VRDKSEILTVTSLEIGYPSGKSARKLLAPLNATAKKGELVAIVGRNGIGKSTLLRTLIGLQPYFGGKIQLSGKDLEDYTRIELARIAAYISTETVRASNMRVYDLVALGRYPHTNWLGSLDPESNSAIINALKITGIPGLHNRFISELSDGERQKAMIARMIAQEAPLMIMDEPTAFLDISGRYDVIDLLLNLTRKGKTILFSTHDFNVAINQADKIWLLLDDRMVEGSPEDLMISGVFEHLFDSSVVRFNPADGNFTFHREHQGEINVIGSGLIKQWTEKAIIRAGFSVTSAPTDPFIGAPSGENKKWILYKGDLASGFDSIYDLVTYLRNHTESII